MSDYIVVHFHADGEQGCEDGWRIFPNTKRCRELAARFAVKRREEPRRSCCRKGVWIEHTDEEREIKGLVYRLESTCGLDDDDWEEWEDE